MMWRQIHKGFILYDLRTGYLHKVLEARVRRGHGPGGWERYVELLNLVTDETWAWGYDQNRDIEPYVVIER